MRIILLLLAGLILGPIVSFSQKRRANPFGGDGPPDYKANNTYAKTFDLSKIGGIGR